MASKVEPLVLQEDVYNVEGELILPSGISVTRKTLDEMPSRANGKSGKFGDTPFFKDLKNIAAEDEYVPILTQSDHQAKVYENIAEMVIPVLVAREILQIRKKSAIQYHHTLATTLLTARAMLEANAEEIDIQKVSRANLVKDLGMSRLDDEILKNREHLTKQKYARIKRHPLISMVLAYHYFGEGVETMIALRHHERRGHGYPKVGADHNQILDLVTMVDIFNALVSPRSFRRESFDVRGAIDEMTDIAAAGEVATWAPKLMAAMYRSGGETVATIELSDKKLGFTPKVNHYGLPAE